MSNIRSSQLSLISVGGTGGDVRASQLALIAVETPEIPINASQLALIVVSANGQEYIELGPAIGLGCWSPCGELAHRYNL